MYIPFLTGLVSILTPVTFLMTFFLLIAFSQFNINKRLRIQIILIFCVTVIVLYSFLGLFILNLSTDSSFNEDSMKIPTYLIYLFSLFFGIWMTGVLKNIIVLDDRYKLRSSLFVIIIAIVFTLETISSTGPLIGSLMINSLSSQNMIDKISPIILFGVGLIIPIGLIILTLGKLIKKLKEKSWWEFFQFISGIAYIVLAIIGQTMK